MSYLNQSQEHLGQELQVWMFTKWMENLSKKDEKSFSENSYNKQKPNTECSCCRVFPVQMHFSEMCTDAWKKSADVCEVCGKHLRQTFLMLRVQRVRVMRTGRKVNRVIKRTEKQSLRDTGRGISLASLSFLKHAQEGKKDADMFWDITFWDQGNLEASLVSLPQINDCEVCGKHFEGHKYTELYMRTHTGEKPFVCTVCGKAFTQNGNLKRHMRGPTGERPCVCSVCGRSFSFEEYMKAHMRIHTEEKLFLCRICRKEFGQRGALKTHIKAWSVIKKLYKPDALKIHMRSHTGEKLYLCNVCGKSFTYQTHGCPQRRADTSRGKTILRKDELKRHLITHGDESIQLISLLKSLRLRLGTTY